VSGRKAFETTTVPPDKTKGEIRQMLLKYDVTQFGIMEEPCRALIGFRKGGRTVRLVIPLPDRSLPAFSKTGAVLGRGTPAALKAHDQEERRIWRAVRTWIFGQLEAVRSGIVTFEEVWLSHTVLPSGQTFSEWAAPQIEQEVIAGLMPHLLSGSALDGRRLGDGEGGRR